MYHVPYVVENTGRGEQAMDIYSRLLKDRIIFIGTDISDGVANAVIAQMLFLRAEDPRKDISIYINSVGGYISSGLAIYDTMKFMGYNINTYCIGQTASIAVLLLAAGTPGKRYALPHSRIKIGQPAGGVGGTSIDIQIQAREISDLKQMCAEILAECSGKSVDQILADSDRDHYMGPARAKEYGFIDHIAVQSQKGNTVVP